MSNGTWEDGLFGMQRTYYGRKINIATKADYFEGRDKYDFMVEGDERDFLFEYNSEEEAMNASIVYVDQLMSVEIELMSVG